ncbi:LysM peptidoglycan-binding domain-containing protein [Metabacillus herbersteinensis]|uniref:LysM peptidoglycan-binding domain-containing protein n=1 Tax=Metabacillus herbersteinensis TaxID=283816 RepID=A0ABV6GD19_9BACI
MSRHEKRPDQAENLRTRIIDDFKEQNGNYPPRSEIHKQVQKKTKMKLKYPVISLLAVFFLLLPILVWLIISFVDNSSFSPVNNDDSTGFEVIKYDNNDGSLEEVEESTQTVDEEDNVLKATGDGESTDKSSVNQESIDTVEQSASTFEKDSVDQSQTTTDPSNTSTSTSPTLEEKKYEKVIAHTVGPEETLFSISIKYYKSRDGEEIIRSYNNLSDNEIYEGQVLKIPLEES